MTEAKGTRSSSRERHGSIWSGIFAAAAVFVFAVCLLVAVRYPNVPRADVTRATSTNLFTPRALIAAFGSAVVLASGTCIIMWRPTRLAVRVLVFGVPAASFVAAIAMPIATLCPPGTFARGGECVGVLFKMVVRGDRSLDIAARLLIVSLGCIGGLYFWILAMRTQGSDVTLDRAALDVTT